MTPKACDAKESECVCNRVGRHKIHRCECGGSWVYNADSLMQPRSWPGGETDMWRAFDRMLDPFAGLFR